MGVAAGVGVAVGLVVAVAAGEAVSPFDEAELAKASAARIKQSLFFMAGVTVTLMNANEEQLFAVENSQTVLQRASSLRHRLR